MAVHSTLSTLMGKYRYSIQDVHVKTGLSRNAISNLYNDKARRIDFETLEKLCRLFKCTVSDLIEFVDNEEGAGSKERNSEPPSDRLQ